MVCDGFHDETGYGCDGREYTHRRLALEQDYPWIGAGKITEENKRVRPLLLIKIEKEYQLDVPIFNLINYKTVN